MNQFKSNQNPFFFRIYIATCTLSNSKIISTLHLHAIRLVPNDTKVEYNSKLIIVQTNFKLVTCMCFANIIILLICKMKTERVKYK